MELAAAPPPGAIRPGRPGLSGSRPIRVMVCDDSAFIRSVFTRVLAQDSAIEVVGRAANGKDALDQVLRQPDLADVMLLDIEMPVMDGLTALPQLLAAAPALRVIIASTLTTRGATTTFEALRLGAVDYVPKPSAATLAGDVSFQHELLAKIRGLARPGRDSASGTSPPPRPLALRTTLASQPQLLAIGSSTGGPQALLSLLRSLKAHLGGAGLTIPVVVTQHMPAAFTPLLADQLDRLSGLPCAEAVDGAPLLPGRVHLAPGGRHLIITRTPAGLVGRLNDGPPENFCRPSVDSMLRSAAEACGGRVLVLMLTGMGHDGLAGTQALVAQGAAAMAQDEASSVVWGMPGAIARAGLCQAVLPLDAMADRAARSLRGAA